nr:GGDEF domain-containing protein [Polaromonas sp.]
MPTGLSCGQVACPRRARPGDLMIRYRGEEFVLLDSSNREAACRAAERLREVVASSAIDCGDATIRFQVSVGVQHGYTLNALLVAADEALYRAKQGGRNRIRAA